jgi:hypothetical protein
MQNREFGAVEVHSIRGPVRKPEYELSFWNDMPLSGKAKAITDLEG